MTSLKKAMEKIGGTADLIHPPAHHWRLTGPKGGQIDFYATRNERWNVHRDSAATGRGLAKALELLATLEDIRHPKEEPPAPGENHAFVTLFADASLDDATKASGYGGWAKRDGQTFETSGPLPDAESSTEAEMDAIYRTLQDAIEQGFIKPGDRVLLQSDCLHALCIFLKVIDGTKAANLSTKREPHGLPVFPARRARASFREHPAVAGIAAAMREHQLQLFMRHVKGHQSIDNPRAWVNHRVDRLARQHMKAQREERRP